MLTDVQYALISSTPFLYPTHSGHLIILDVTTAYANSNIWNAHTKEVHLFREVTVVEQVLLQQIVGTTKEAYLSDICNMTTKSIYNTVAGVLTYLQDNYGQLMLHELLEREGIIKKTIYNPCNPITTVFSKSEEIFDLPDIRGT